MAFPQQISPPSSCRKNQSQGQTIPSPLRKREPGSQPCAHQPISTKCYRRDTRIKDRFRNASITTRSSILAAHRCILPFASSLSAWSLSKLSLVEASRRRCSENGAASMRPSLHASLDSQPHESHLPPPMQISTRVLQGSSKASLGRRQRSRLIIVGLAVSDG